MYTNRNSWDSMISRAADVQQEYYELLPEWTIYKKNEYKYLKQNIGFALFGPPMESQNPNNPQQTNFILTTDILSSNNIAMIDTFRYKPELQDIINSIFEQIRVQGEGGVDGSIYYGIIYNVMLSSKNGSTANSSDLSNASKKRKIKKHYSSANNKTDESEINIRLTPVFKIKKFYAAKRQTSKLNRPESWHVTWYIDINGRVYESWTDYKENNTLPKCTMVLPKDGFYQPNPMYEITEKFSKVWVEVLDSPACSAVNNVLGAIDTASSIVSVIGLGLGIATLFTPLASVAVGAMAASRACGAWTVGRSAQNLLDKKVHRESLKDRNALCSWLGLTGGAVGLATAGGTRIITKAVEKGNKINTLVRAAYNALVIGNVSINGVGMIYQGYCLYDKYIQKEQIRKIDVLNFGMHVLFFGNSAMNFPTAEKLIESTQGKILKDYRTNIGSRRLRQSFERVIRYAAENNTDKASENAEVIKYINSQKNFQELNPNLNDIQTRNCITFANGKILLNGVTFLDPMIFVELLLSARHNRSNSTENSLSSCDQNDYNPMFYKLKDLLINLLCNYNLETGNEDVYKFDIDDFDETIQDMKYMDNATDILTLIFKLAIALSETGEIDSTYLADATFFLWSYVKQNLRQICINMSSFVNSRKLQKKIIDIIIALFDELDEVVKRLLPAFSKYIKEKLKS